MTWPRRRPRWREQMRARHPGMPPRVVMRMGCNFMLMIGLAAIGAGALVSMVLRQPHRPLAITAMAVMALLMLLGGFVRSMRAGTRFFGEQIRLRRQLLADVAHELRTPLSILQGRIEGLLDGVYERDDARLNELLDETRHLGRIVEDVRTLANADAGALDLRKERIDLGELIRDTAASFDFPITVDVVEPLPPIDADPVRIREVLLNLLSNAVRHTPPGGTIRIHAEARNRRITMRVTDTGSGISPDELPHIFERFQKGRDSRGSGLGLAISRKLVLAHDGEISAESRVGEGTTVTVVLRSG